MHKGGGLSPTPQGIPEEKLILIHNMIITWWLHLLAGLGHHVIRPGVIEQVLVMAKNLMTF